MSDDKETIPTEAIPEAPVNFPKVSKTAEAFYDDERHEVWIGVKLRATVKGKTKEDGPVEDIEVNLDPMFTMACLDSVKPNVFQFLMQDGNELMQARARKKALSDNGILSRLSAGLGNIKKTLIH